MGSRREGQRRGGTGALALSRPSVVLPAHVDHRQRAYVRAAGALRLRYAASDGHPMTGLQWVGYALLMAVLIGAALFPTGRH